MFEKFYIIENSSIFHSMSDSAPAGTAYQRSLLVPALVIGTMSVSVSNLLQLFLVDIGNTFNVSVGVASQLATVNHAGEFISALAMGVLAVRFRYKPLILAGMLLVLFSAIGGFLAPDFVTTRLIYSIAFYREFFSVSRDLTVVISMATLVVFIIGSLVSGRLTNRFGAKPVSVTVSLLGAVFLMAFFFVPILWGSLVLNFLIILFVSIGVTSGVCLALAQVPKSRGTMMSLNSVVGSLGTTIGPAVGGALLILIPGYYGVVGLALGGMLAASAIILFFLAKDTTRT
jgi:predicted MFS family arabinose efflux permease